VKRTPSRSKRTSGKTQKPVSQHEKASFYAGLKILEKLAKALWVEPHELIAPPPKKRRLIFPHLAADVILLFH
jgi:hypothetical protein